MSLNPTHANKRKHPRKIGTQTLTPKSRQAKTHLAKINFCDVTRKFVLTNSCLVLARSKVSQRQHAT